MIDTALLGHDAIVFGAGLILGFALTIFLCSFGVERPQQRDEQAPRIRTEG